MKKRNINNEISLQSALLVDGAHCVEHHGKPTDCLKEVCFRSEPIKTQTDLRFQTVEMYACHDEELTSPKTQPEKYNTAKLPAEKAENNSTTLE